MIKTRTATRSLSHFKSKWVSLLALGFLIPSISSADSPGEPEPSDRFCTLCHGAKGQGNIAVSAPRLAGMEPWYLRRQLELFRSGIRGTHVEDLQGQEMQATVDNFTDESMEDIIQWVASWDYQPAEPSIHGGDADKGRRLYQSCIACHGDSAQGKEAVNAPALAGQNDWYLLTQLKNFKAGYRGSHPDDRFGAQMKAMAQVIPDEEAMIDLVSYINGLSQE